MKCPTCSEDITEPIKQFGNPREPICQSCFLAGVEYDLTEANYISYLMSQGMTFDEAKAEDIKLQRKELIDFMNAESNAGEVYAD